MISFKILLLTFLPILLHPILIFACSTGPARDGMIYHGNAMKESSKMMADSLDRTSKELKDALNQNTEKVAQVVQKVSSSLSELAKKVSIRIDSGDLQDIGVGAATQLKEALVKVSENWELAINTSDLKDFGAEAAKYLSEAIQNINLKIELIFGIDPDTREALEGVTFTLRNISQDLAGTVNQSVEKAGETVKHLGDKLAEVAKNVNISINSGDLAYMGEGAAKYLGEALVGVSQNWQMALNTKDLENIGAKATMYLSQALKSINAKFHFHFTIGEEVGRAVRDISIAGGIAFSVLFIGILVGLKSCRKCSVGLIQACGENGGCCKGGNREEKESGREMKSLMKNNKERRGNDVAKGTEFRNEDDFRTKSLIDFEGIGDVRKFWEEIQYNKEFIK